MAVELAERGVGAIATILAADLETELTAIDTDRGDAPVVAGSTTTYYKYPNPVIGGGETHIEVFENAYEFDNPYSDAASNRATYQIPITVRVTYFNRDGESATTFTTRARRLTAGVFNVLNKKPDLAGADAAIQAVAAASVEPQWITDGEDEPKIIKAVTTIQLLMRCEEVQ